MKLFASYVVTFVHDTYYAQIHFQMWIEMWTDGIADLHQSVQASLEYVVVFGNLHKHASNVNKHELICINNSKTRDKYIQKDKT